MRLTATAILAALAALPAFATVNVNTAQQSELQAVPGLDKYKAKTLIEYRNEHGPFRSLDDVARALGESTAEKVSSRVAFDGPPYIAPPKPAKPKTKKKKKGSG
jgi:competence protein ComEA